MTARLSLLLVAGLLAASLAEPTQARMPPRTFQGFVIDVWLTEDGLPDNTVTAIAQSPDGYLWVGTGSGLARFDGQKFEIVDSANLPGLGDNFITHLAAEGTGRIWIHTLNSGAGYLEGGKFHPAHSTDGQPLRYITALADADGRIAIATGRPNLDVMAYRNGQFVPYSRHKPTESFSIPSLALDKRGTLWAATHDEGAYYFEEGGWVPVSPPNSGSRDRTGINFSQDGGVLIGHANQLFKWREGRWVAHVNGKTSVPLRGYTHFLEDIHGNLWLVSDARGLLQMRPDGKEVPFDKGAGLPGNWIRSTFEDHEGNIWVGVDSGGLVRLKRAAFESFTTEHGLTSSVATTLAEDPSGRVFVGTNPGLVAWDGDMFSAAAVPAGFPTGAYAWALLFDRNGALWMGTYGSALYKWENGKTIQLAFQTSGISIAALFEDRDGAVWVGSDVGLHRQRDGMTQHFTRTNGLSCEKIYAIAQTPDGDIWAGGDEGGLSRIRMGNSTAIPGNSKETTADAQNPPQITHYNKENGLPGRTIRSLFVDGEGTLWIGTRRSGLSRFKDEKFFNYTTAQGLPDLAINSIIDDDLGNLWMGTQRGIFRVAKEDLHAVADKQTPQMATILYNRGDGLVGMQSTAMHQPNAMRTRDGRLWFATVNGVSVTTPNQLGINRLAPSVRIERIELDGDLHEMQPLLPESLPQKGRLGKSTQRTNTYTIPPGVNRIVLHCNAICLKAPEKVRFMWKLDGVDGDWVQAGNTHLATYRNLAPGSYRFQVRACNDEGTWNWEGASITLDVLPFYWETTWFRGGVILLVGSLLFAGGRIRLRRQFARRLQILEAENALGRERSRIARDLHDDLGPTVSRIILQVELASQKLAEDSHSRLDLQRIAGNANEIVWRLDQIVWALNPNNDEMENVVTYICKYAVDLFQETQISCRLDAPGQFPKVEVRSNHRHHLFLGVKEALNNVLKHSSASEVRLQFKLEPPTWSIAVIDNGRGFDPTNVPVGRNGLANLQARASHWEGTCVVASAPGAGTKVEFRGRIPTRPKG